MEQIRNINEIKMKTPYYVIHKEVLDSNYHKLEESLKKYWNNYIIGYSYKTNSLPWIVSHFSHLGAYAEVVSEDEYNLAKLIGGVRSKIIYNGPIKTKKSFIEAIENGAIINIDSHREVEWLKEINFTKKNIGIRVNFDIEKMCPGQSQCAEEGGRFGFCYENGELKKVICELRKYDVTISGLHLHTSSKSRGLDIYRAIAETACKICQEYNLELSYIDVGGGFFGGLEGKPQYDEYISLMESILAPTFDKAKTKLIVEPGMALIGAPISYVTSVIDVKDTTFNRFVVTDGTRTSIDPLMSKNTYFYSLEVEEERTKYSKQVICGYTCMEHDRLFVLNDGPALMLGDRIIYDKVGAYTMCLTPLFIKYFPDVYVEEKEGYRIVRNKWTIEEYIKKSVI